MTDLELENLEAYFQNRKEVVFAFLCGSQARGVATRLFDVDMNIAVYFYPKTTHHIEYEEKVYYEHEDIIWREVERILKREVELLVLNRASASVSASAIRGIPLAIHDREVAQFHVSYDFREY